MKCVDWPVKNQATNKMIWIKELIAELQYLIIWNKDNFSEHCMFLFILYAC